MLLLPHRLEDLLLVGVGLTFVLAPDLSTWVANRFGIGRGADLILYIFVVFSLFHLVTIASQLNRIERQITALARRGALADPELGAGLAAESRTERAPARAARSES